MKYYDETVGVFEYIDIVTSKYQKESHTLVIIEWLCINRRYREKGKKFAPPEFIYLEMTNTFN